MAPGKTAPRLLQDLLTYDARYEERAGRNLLTSAPPQHDPSRPPAAAVPHRNCRHALVTKDEQSLLPSPQEEPTQSTVYKVASYCSQCRWHIDVVVDFRNGSTYSRTCKKGDTEYFLHHFVYEEEPEGNATFGLGNQLAPRSYIFCCSAPQCPVKARVHMKPPRLSDQDIETLTNQAQLRRRWEAAKQKGGERADNTMARRVDGPDFLNTYLQDSLNPVQGKARIPLLNKKFLKTFGSDCDSILTRLGFTSEWEEDGDPASQVWNLPRPGVTNDVLQSTLRNTIEDTRYELNTIILGIPENERVGARHKAIYPSPSRMHIERALACHDYDKVKGRIETRNTNHEEDHPYYASLGAIGDFSDELILFSFARQTSVDVENRSYYYECLQDLANGRKSEELQMQVAMLGSQGFNSRREVEAAYRYFNIQPAHAIHLNDDHIIGSFKSRLSDMSPSMAEETRRQLRIIGDARNSATIRAEAADALETYGQALSWLDLTHDQPDDFVVTMVSLKTSDNPESLDTARKAVSLIAEHRNSDRLRQYLRDGSMTAPEMDLGEAYALFSIMDRSAAVDLDVMKTTIQFAPPESAEKMQKAYLMIEQDQAQNHGNSSSQSVVRRNNYPLDSWPVGLRNIGNTCYLNSVLQFLFTIQPLRELVLNCEEHFEDTSPETLSNKTVGRTAVTAERVEVAQKFVRELRTFFNHMITAPTDTVQPAIDLAALALCKTDSPQSAPRSPTLDAQQSNGLGSIEGAAVMGPLLPPSNEIEAVSSADSVMADDKSDTSMQAMDLQEQSQDANATQSAQPAPPTRPPPIPPRPAAPSKSIIGNIEESARQQDAAEVLSNIFDLFSCAIKGKGVLREGEQMDTIKELFFSDVTSVRNTKPKPEESNELRDHFLVSPGWRDRNLYATLDDDFGLSEMEGGVTKYDYIKTASPIQIINLRRLQFDRTKGEQVYDRSYIGLDTRIYLDRYLGETSSLSQEQLLELRQAQWEKQRLLRVLDERRDALQRTDIDGLDLAETVDETRTFMEGLSKKYEEANDATLPTPPPELVDALSEKAAYLRKDIERINAEMSQLEEGVDKMFKDSQDHPYRLHAIFTHRGGTKGGHYWIYIYDFQNNKWRKYNDDLVTDIDEKDVFKQEEGVIRAASTGVVYIREDLITEVTEAVKRQPTLDEADSGANEHAGTQASDVQMQDANDEATLPHKPREPVKYNDIQIIEGIEKA
ncbi:ubiquitin C-terminal hydrolase-like protein [Phaeosphaeria sp. MPI-PUGE-AT-0046c]|nr:ubiquitin C-terminal hydrolase-like protein [Phaeosphaeria sp. MPI-PUGE-AT-0046c]